MKTFIKDINYSPKQASFIFSAFDHLFDVNEGSIRAGKTAADDARLALFYLVSPNETHLVSAYNQELAYKLFIEGDGLGLAYIFDGVSHLRRDRGGDHLEIDLPSGKKKVYFKGGGKSNSANSIRGLSLGSVAYSEMNLLDKEFIDESFRRTAAAKIRYHLADLNPPAPHDPIIETFKEYGAHWLHWTMSDNPVMSKQRLKGMEEQLKRNPYLYKRDWLGLRVMPQGVIYSMFDDKEMTDQTLVGEPVEMFFAGDAGQNDATTLSCNIVTRVVDGDGARFVLNRVANYYHSGTETGETKAMSTYAEELRQFINWCHQKYQLYYSNIVIDPAAKTLRAELERLGIMSSPANNNGNEKVGSVRGIEVGIERLQNLMTNQQFRLVEPNSDLYSHYHFIKELGMYVRDENTGNPVDMNNHAMDEARYAANYFTSRYE
ncbi:PBSX family phage terminase large subunit [Pediococcus acidilactici]|uniref:PBSX family phage terminase large subunit n=1 Tax=Pediococcus acidilactici TaxID=1254 RepID=UPI00132983C7|nr:PBSX family phage terminase large subunit [Pediococcus acidilactici]KAF0338505.1 PBSX family phage terminase large subunit [Pediococcus acidilactici]KAF0350587.1 PBSX family phage terminase large subunit [Pediococcus acidilactici]KAF0415948.1 PBSX family phage terminase large subunit [Pediococcus acidilactici]KAF0464203.1 PBSX family phage terminase large subunit [Pediococcus acidilactici]KAF0505342.1 PBSX family phage terminase large subunit [Pediococcus acidilactici]